MHKVLAQAGTPIGSFEGTEVSGYLPQEAGGLANACITLSLLLTNILTFLTIVAGLAFTTYFVIGGITWITAGGDKDKVDRAKKYMTNGAIGLIIIVASYAIVGIVSLVLGLDILNPALLLTTLGYPGCNAESISNLAFTEDAPFGSGGIQAGGGSLAILMAVLFRTTTLIGGLALFLYFAWGGIEWLTAGGDKDKVEKARNRLTNAAIGLAILMGTIAISILLSEIFQFDILNPIIPTP